MNNAVFGKNMENVRKYGDMKLITIEEKRSCLVSGHNYHPKKWFSENLLAKEVKKIKVSMNKPVNIRN